MSNLQEAGHRFDNDKRRMPELHVRQQRLTPDYILKPICRLLGEIELDPCTEPDNPTNAKRFYSPPEDGCELPWDASTIFCNPPYGEARLRWVFRCLKESDDPSKKIVLLIPAHTDTKIAQLALSECSSVLFVRSRIKFGFPRPNGRQQASSHPSMLLGFGVDLTPISNLGIVMKYQLFEDPEVE